MSKDLELAIQAAKSAGRIIQAAYGDAKKITKKGLNDFVTETDLQAERIIIEQLRQTGYSILGEETGETDNQSRKKWVIDPLDGTANFIRGFPFFAVSIALIEDDKNLVLGVVYDPIADECFWAERNEGAFMNGKKINVSQHGDFDGSVFLVEHGRSEKNQKDYLQALHHLMLDQGAVVLRQGSTALMLCYMAKGSAEAFLSCGDELYDFAAGLMIAKEAGANISDWNGKPWDNSNSFVLASNVEMREKILARLAGLQHE